MTVQAIQTEFDGHLFRSRLEARWAMFFNTFGIKYRYELEGYRVGSDYYAHNYLPDFYLPETGTWVEVKGDLETVNWGKIAAAVDWGTGLPGTENSLGTTHGLLMLGNIPKQTEPYQIPIFPIIQHNKGVMWEPCAFVPWEGKLQIVYDAKILSFSVVDSTWGDIPNDHPFVRQVINLLENQDFLEVTRNVYFRSMSAYWELNDAYKAASRARFEYGETPR